MAKTMHSRVQQDVRYIYAGMAIAMWNNIEGLTDDEKTDYIAQVIYDSQDVWADCANGGISVLDLCEEVTGLDIRTCVK